MSKFVFGKRSENNLLGVHPDLVRVARRALELSEVDFTVIEGRRTPTRQKALVEAGASWTMNSRHLTGHAIDVAPYIGGTIRWDWPPFFKIADAFKQASKELDIPIVWGGDWKVRDGPHVELDRRRYPA